MAKYNDEELGRIQEILNPLNENPIVTESLNPMGKVLRKIKGEPEPEMDKPPEEGDGGIEFNEEGENQEDGENPPEFKNFDEDDDSIDDLLDVDIDSLGKESDDAPEEELPEDLGEEALPEDESPAFDEPPSFDEEPVAEDESPAFDEPPSFDEEPEAEDESPAFDEPPSFDEEPEAEEPVTEVASDAEDDPFADVTPDATEDEDPFADLGQAQSGANDFGGEDPFAEEPPVDPDFGSEDSEADLGSDLDMEPPSMEEESEADPLADIGDLDLSDEEPVPALDEESETDPLAGMDEPEDEVVSDLGGDPDALDEESTSAVDADDMFSEMESPEPADEGVSELGEAEDGNLGGGLGDISDEDDLGDFGEEEDDEEEGNIPELTDEELAIIQQEIIHYPPKLKRTVIDSITKDKLSPKEQRELIDLIKSSAKPDEIAAYLTDRLGYPVELQDPTGLYSETGIPIISSNPIYTKKGEFERRQLIKRTLFGAAAAILLITTLVSGYKYVFKPLRAAAYYNDGLEDIKKAGVETNQDRRKELLMNAERNFLQGEKINPNDMDYLNKYGMAYMKVGEYKQSFTKLFGEVQPDFGMESSDPQHTRTWSNRVEVPIISLAPGQIWDEDKLQHGATNDPDPRSYLRLVSQDKVERRIVKAGSYIVAELGKKIHDNETYINLGRFHSNVAQKFVNGEEGQMFKNDQLAINYFKQVFTDGGDPTNVEANAGLAKIYYNQESFGKAASYYNKIIEVHPKDPTGHGGLLSTYIEMWRRDRNPQFVLNHHRQVRNSLEIEGDLSLFVLSKLAAFYIDLDPTELRIKYNVTPEDQVTNMDIDDNIIYILNLSFSRSENQDGMEVSGDEYAEQYYQRGRYYIGKNESMRALKQFELAATYDPAHYLAVMEMAEHFIRQENNQEGWKLLENAEKRYQAFHKNYGNREEDETLIRGDVGRIYFNMGKIIYLGAALVNLDDKIDEYPARKVYPNHDAKQLTENEIERKNNLNNSLAFFAKALKYNLSDDQKIRELHYYTGWINYMNSDYEAALGDFSNLGEEDSYENPNVMMGRASAYYYTDQINASLGNYLKLKDDFEEREAKIQVVVPEETSHQEIYQTLIAVYNNIGAIYERKGNTSQALKNYWKSIETARKLNTVTEIANYNKDMLFKGRDEVPLIDDWLSPTIDTIKELQKSKRRNNFL